ncbi:MAG: glycine--tRNA ligase [Candidatus Aenigmarchaeota archaeon]|nr:glycine--tRNA ligase [Candidatus Aenigmarchaeota archaeon]
MKQQKASLFDKVVNLCARRGVIFPNSEIYGSNAGFFDFGNYGAQLKKNIENSWWKHFVTTREDIVGIDGAIITHPTVWEASGHTESFNDPLVECKKCHKRFRADHLVENTLNISVDGMSLEQIQELLKKHEIKCPDCKNDFTLVKLFNLMFKSNIGAVEDEGSVVYLRPETAQLMFADFKQIQATSRKKLPFGIAQIGKAFRNEISPRNFVFRSREFSQMEIEYFVHPKKLNECSYLNKSYLDFELNVLTSDMQQKKQEHKKMSIKHMLDKKLIKTKWHAYWIAESFKWFTSIGLKKENLRVRQHMPTELSHYALETWDVEYNYPWGWKELQGIANRTDFDLKQHMKFSNKDMTYFDEDSKEKVIPHVIEPSWGLERTILTVLMDAYSEKTEDNETKITLKLHQSLSPVQVAVFPLMKKDNLDKKAREIFDMLKKDFICEYDESGSIGKRYARADEIGAVACITIDYDSLKKDTVTIRDRDTTKQIRAKIKELQQILKRLMEGEKLENIGKIVKSSK